MSDLGTIDALARLQLAARRLGLDLRLRDVSPELCELIDLVGLAGVLRVEPRGQAEEREQGLGVEEEGQLDDPAV
jgi:anti-anti-sigma regulatory factor